LYRKKRAEMEGLLGKFRTLDVYPKINEDFYRRTLSGGIITLASSIVMLLLFISELRKLILLLLLLLLDMSC
jgi:multisubunit Na+/H+ antiporter MnhG subunit